MLLARYGLSETEVPASGARLSALDVEGYIASRRLRPAATAARVAERPRPPDEPGKRVSLTPNEHGVLRAVAWQRMEAAPAYVEVPYDPAPWAEFAAAFQKRHGLLLNPLLPLFGWCLGRIAAEMPGINATLVDDVKHCFDHVNLGFTVQSENGLFVVVAREVETLSAADGVRRLVELQRSAMRNALRPDEAGGATIGFSSMARWNVTRHVPLLLPHTSLMVAHSAPAGAVACLGATYDHRVLTGADAVRVLQTLSHPPGDE
jgi:pyruvate/2-oxoglutarate dehydrogenase complex dihydrolipoamide acyltransferase (E2) component